jgi:hypothetical protein
MCYCHICTVKLLQCLVVRIGISMVIKKDEVESDKLEMRKVTVTKALETDRQTDRVTVFQS